VELFKAVKANHEALLLENEFYEKENKVRRGPPGRWLCKEVGI
jgi:hypothetical protein